jgi:hypothetical protein
MWRGSSSSVYGLLIGLTVGCASQSNKTQGTQGPGGSSGSGSSGNNSFASNSSSGTGSSGGSGIGSSSSGGSPLGGTSSSSGGNHGGNGGSDSGSGGPAAQSEGGAVAAGDAGDSGGGGTTGLSYPYHDPGTGPWEMVSTSDVGTVCKLDLSKLQAAESSASYPFIVVRYGKVCYATASAMNFAAAEAYSTTKTLGSTVVGIAAYQSKGYMKTGMGTGPLDEMDRVDQWLPSVPATYNKDAHIVHVLGMVAHDTDLTPGNRSFTYDTVGSTEINSLSDIVNAVVKQDSANLTTDIEAFTQKFLFTPLGMKNSTWSSGSTTKVFAYTWSTDLFDMARVGVLLTHYGWWNNQRVMDTLWVYRQTHPNFEDANTAFGYLAWLNSPNNWVSISPGTMTSPMVPCAPVCIHKLYPHGTVDQLPDCHLAAPATCTQKYDVGVFQAVGLGGQIIQGHRGLDLVVVARNMGGSGPGSESAIWNLIRPAVVGGDPKYMGDDTSFCNDYGSNNYAPDMHEDPPEPQ